MVVWCSKFTTCIIVVVVLSNLVFGILSYMYASSPYSFFTESVPTDGPENYEFDDIRTLLANYTQNYTNPEVWLCVGITTMNRSPRPSYLLKTVHSLFAGLSKSEQKQIYVVINNADTNPDNYTDAKLLSNYVEVIQQTDTSLFMHPKQLKDYANTLSACYNKAQYTLILEDDVAATHHWVNKLAKYIPELEKMQEQEGKYLYVKLFDMRAYNGWENSDATFLSLVGISSGIVAAIIFRIILHTEKSPAIKSIILGTYIGGVVVVFLLAIGKQNVFPPTRGVHPLDNECCSQAHLYPNYLVKPLSDYLYTQAIPRANNWADRVMTRWAKSENYKTLVLYPAFFQHMGAVSSVIANDRSYIISYTYTDFKK